TNVVSATVRESPTDRSRLCSANRSPATTPVRIIAPAGSPNLATSRTNRPGCHGPRLGGRARKKVGVPIVRIRKAAKADPIETDFGRGAGSTDFLIAAI